MKHESQSPYYAELGRLSFSPGWARTEPSMWPQPKPKFRPAVWRFAAAKRALDQSGSLVPAEQTERRNLIMVNPVEGNTYATTRTLVAAYQCVLPGEIARTHRHSAAALRLVIAAEPGTYTVVNGARIDMAPIGMHLVRQPAGGRIEAGKTTVNHLYAVSSGKARVRVEGGFDETLGVGDLVAVPCWHDHSIEAAEDTVIFRVCDEPLLRK